MRISLQPFLAVIREQSGFLSGLRVGIFCLCLSGGCAALTPKLCHTTARQQRKLDEARDLMQENKYQKAEGIARDVVRQAPSNVDGRKLLVTLYLEQGRFDDSIQEMRKILQINPEETETLTELAILLIERRRYSEAEAMIDQALLVNPNDSQLLKMQGELRERRGADRNALACYYRILGNNPDDVEATMRAAVIESRNGRGEQAIPLLRQLLANPGISSPLQRDAQLMLADACAERMRWDEAAGVLSDAVKAGEPSNDLLYKLSYAQFRSGDVSAGKQTLAELLTQDPADPRAMELAGQFAPQLLNSPNQPARTAIIPVGHSRLR